MCVCVATYLACIVFFPWTGHLSLIIYYYKENGWHLSEKWFASWLRFVSKSLRFIYKYRWRRNYQCSNLMVAIYWNIRASDGIGAACRNIPPQHNHWKKIIVLWYWSRPWMLKLHFFQRWFYNADLSCISLSAQIFYQRSWSNYSNHN